MIFRVKFECNCQYNKVVHKLESTIGLKLLKELKENYPNLNNDALEGYIKNFSYSEYILKITEDQAEEVGLFENDNIINVTVDQYFLNNFTKLQLFNRNLNYRAEWYIDDDLLYEEWKKTGFVKDWRVK